MLKLIIGILVLLAICVAIAVYRKLRGGTFYPPPQDIDGQPEPQSLKDLAERRRAERSRSE